MSDYKKETKCNCGEYWVMNRVHKQECPTIKRVLEPHSIHRTKDLFDSNYVFCREVMKERDSHWEDGL